MCRVLIAWIIGRMAESSFAVGSADATSMSWSVTPRWAETTTATSSPALWCCSRISTTRPIHFASATDVPPNFIRSLISVSLWMLYVTIRPENNKMLADEVVDCHVLVIGSGGAGVRAAIEASHYGDTVLISKTIVGKGGC